MGLLEERTFPLDNSMKVIVFEHISDCLRCDRIRKNVVDEMGGLHSIITSSSGDLVNNGLFVTWRQLGGMPSFAVSTISIHLLLNSTNSGLPQTSFGLDLMQGIAFLKKGDDNRALSG